MPKRFEQIIFKDFSGLSNQEFYDPKNPSRFLIADKLQNNKDNNRLELADDYANAFEISEPFEASPHARPILTFTTSVGSRTQANFLAVNDAENSVKIYRKFETAATYLLKYTFSGDYNYPKYFIGFKDKMLLFLRKTTSYTRTLSYSSDFANSFTDITWAYGDIVSHVVGVDGYLYVVDKNGVVLRTIDGITWIVFYDGSATNETIVDISELDGQLYVIVTSLNSDSYLARLYESEINYFYTFTGIFNTINFLNFDDRLIFISIVKGAIVVYEFNKGDVIKINYIDDRIYTSAYLLYSDDNFLYFSAAINFTFARYFFRINKNNSIYFLKDFGSTNVIDTVVGFAGELTIHTTDTDSANITVHDNRINPINVGSGSIETPIIEGSQIPAYLILTHRPLLATTLIFITANINYEDGYGESLATVNTDDATYTVISLKELISVEIHSIQFQISLVDNSKNSGIEDLQLIYLYNPSGIENSND
jgi:hypothetical protein